LLRQELGIATFEDLLFYFPYRYFDKTEITKIKDINPHSEYVQLCGTIINIGEEGNKRPRLVATLFDDTGRIELLWFQGISYVKKSIREREQYIVFGKVGSFNGYFNMVHPEVEPLTSEAAVPGLQPVYSTTEKLKARSITNRSFAKLTSALFDKVSRADVPEILPADILRAYGLCNRYDAISWVHFPDSFEHNQLGLRRMKWEELFIS
jgi:ATP-dependent DNA helicase RecG